MRLNPFRAVRPQPDLAAQVAAVPYDVVNRAEAAELAGESAQLPPRRPLGHRSAGGRRPVRSPDLRRRARGARPSSWPQGTLLRDERARASSSTARSWTGAPQTGVVGCVHVDDYERDVIRKHEKTRQDKEDDRTRHVLTLNANAEPVFLTYRGRAGDRRAGGRGSSPHGAALRLHRARRRAAHGLARCPTRRARPGLRTPCARAYVADGHHRSRQRLARGEGAAGEEPVAPRRRGVQLVPGRALSGGSAPDPAVQPRGADLNGLTPERRCSTRLGPARAS